MSKANISFITVYFDLLQRLFGVAQDFHHFSVARLFDVCRHGSHGRELRATYYSIPFYKAVVLFLSLWSCHDEVRKKAFFFPPY